MITQMIPSSACMQPIQYVLGMLVHVLSVCATFLHVARHIGGALVSVMIGMRYHGLTEFAKDMRREHRSV